MCDQEAAQRREPHRGGGTIRTQAAFEPLGEGGQLTTHDRGLPSLGGGGGNRGRANLENGLLKNGWGPGDPFHFKEPVRSPAQKCGGLRVCGGTVQRMDRSDWGGLGGIDGREDSFVDVSKSKQKYEREKNTEISLV